MRICTRFLNDHFKTFGKYQFIWSWWLPREISLNEFRVGAPEYEFVDGADRERAVHIPSDADLSKASVDNSIKNPSSQAKNDATGFVNQKKIPTCTWGLKVV